MAARSIGMDPDLVADYTARLMGQCAALDEVVAQVESARNASLNPSLWNILPGGFILSGASIFAAESARADVASARESALSLVRGLSDDILAQRLASAPTDAAFFAGLTDAQARSLALRNPLVMGNTNGVPIDIRILANAQTARDRLREPGLSDDERDYLTLVVAGTIKLVSYDPGSDRIIEMLGTPSSSTTTVITYVPGTGATLDGFYDGSTQKVAQHMVETDPEGTVAFVVKEGTFPPSVFEAKDQEYAQAPAESLYQFEAAMQKEPLLADATQVGMGHSWGLANIATSETYGAHYDKVLSLSGAWMPDGWKADPTTEYSHYVHLPDILNTGQEAGVVADQRPMNNDAFDKHLYLDSDELKPWNMPGAIMDNHGQIATDREDNQRALEDMYREIYDK